MTDTKQPEAPKCKYCGKPIEHMHQREIIYRGYDRVQRRQVVKKERMDFCSTQCSSSYQMSCEG